MISWAYDQGNAKSHCPGPCQTRDRQCTAESLWVRLWSSLDNDLGTARATAAGRDHASAARVKGGMNQPQHLGAVGVHGNHARFKGSPVQRCDTNIVVCARLDLQCWLLVFVAACSSLQYIPPS